MKRKTKQLQTIFAGCFLLALVIWIQSETLLRILLAFSMCWIVFLLYPYASVQVLRLRRRLFGQLYGYRNIGQVMTGQKLAGMADSFASLAESVRDTGEITTKPVQPDQSKLMEELSDKFCRDCEGCDSCWGVCAENSYLSICELLELGCTKGSILPAEVPERFRLQCGKAELYAEELNRSLLGVRRENMFRSRLAESRSMLADQMTELSLAVRGFSRMMNNKEEAGELQKQMIAAALCSEKVLIREIALYSGVSGGKEVRICARGRRGHCMTSKTAAASLSALLDLPLQSGEENRNVIGCEYAEYVFYEVPKYYVLTGCAQMIREGKSRSGDNYSFLKTNCRNSVMILADGMGCGAEAGKDSTMVVELLEQLLDSGFEEASVVRLLNAVLVLKSEQVKFTTLDLGILNLYTGNCEFIKAGAATTYIKRKNWVESIASTSMPLGVIDRIEYETKHKKLYPDDYVIMLSDGALDCIGLKEREEYMEQLIAGMREKSPQEMANTLLQGILKSPGYTARDDITILVTGLFEEL